MWTLGIDTSGRAGSIALLRDAVVIDELELSAVGRRHARSLVPEIGAMLRRQSVPPRELGVVAVSIGPGSFTGLRVGVVCAKTLAYALREAKLIAVDTFLAVAEGTPAGSDRLAIVEDALREEVFAGIYQRTASGWRIEQSPALQPFQDWVNSLPPGITVTGPGLEKLHQALPTQMSVAPRECWNPQARCVAQLGLRSVQQGQCSDLWTLEPFYIRRSAAEEKADAQLAVPS